MYRTANLFASFVAVGLFAILVAVFGAAHLHGGPSREVNQEEVMGNWSSNAMTISVEEEPTLISIPQLSASVSKKKTAL